MSRFLPFPLLFLFFILESIFVELLPEKFLDNSFILVPHFLLSGIILLTIFGSKKLGIIYGLVFGLMFDIVYTEILGIYLFMLPLTAYLTTKVMKILQANVVIVTFVALLGIGVLELVVYEMNFLIHMTSMPFTLFLINRLLPTLVLNLVFLIIIVYPLKKRFVKLNEQVV